MYEYISGELIAASVDYAVIDCSGVGYRLDIPASTANRLPSNGERVKLLVHFHVREDTQRLFGFLQPEEREVFRHLLSINKVGPKVALNILSGITIDDLVRAVQTQDPSRFKAISGIGPKTAQRLVLELKGKLKIETIAKPKTDADDKDGATSDRFSASQGRTDAFDGMIALGYNEAQVATALARVDSLIDDENLPAEEWIRKALQVI